MTDPLRHHRHIRSAAFGSDTFGQLAERFARFFGTPGFIIGQTLVVLVWVAMNALVVMLRWDPYPFILLNLMFSTQAAYAAPLILLAQTRQADRDGAVAAADAKHRQELADQQQEILNAIHQQVTSPDGVADILALLRDLTPPGDNTTGGSPDASRP